MYTFNAKMQLTLNAWCIIFYTYSFYEFLSIISVISPLSEKSKYIVQYILSNKLQKSK